MLLRHTFLPGEVRRYTIEIYLTVADVRSRATVLCVDKIRAGEAEDTWFVGRKTRVFQRLTPLMKELFGEVLSVPGAPGPDGEFLWGPLGPQEGMGYHFPVQEVELGQSWPSGSLTLTREAPRKKDAQEVVRLGLSWDKPDSQLVGQLVFHTGKGAMLGIQALTSWTAGKGIEAHILVQNRLRERHLATPDGVKKESGPTAKLLGF